MSCILESSGCTTLQQILFLLFVQLWGWPTRWMLVWSEVSEECETGLDWRLVSCLDLQPAAPSVRRGKLLFVLQQRHIIVLSESCIYFFNPSLPLGTLGTITPQHRRPCQQVRLWIKCWLESSVSVFAVIILVFAEGTGERPRTETVSGKQSRWSYTTRRWTYRSPVSFPGVSCYRREPRHGETNRPPTPRQYGSHPSEI